MSVEVIRTTQGKLPDTSKRASGEWLLKINRERTPKQP